MSRQVLLVVLCFAELLLISFTSHFVHFKGAVVAPFILLSLTLGIAFLFLRLSSENEVATCKLKIGVGTAWMIFAFMSVIMFYLGHLAFIRIPISPNDTSKSDIIPQIMILTSRFMHGQMPYAPIHFSTFTLFPTYLPLQWMPYTMAEALHIDYRWIPLSIYWLTSLYFFRVYLDKKCSESFNIISALWPGLVWLILLGAHRELLATTVESLVASFYLLVALALDTQKGWLLAIGIALCMLSRFSIVLWVPLCLLLLTTGNKQRIALAIATTTALFFIIFYWYPFLRLQPDIFMRSYAYHTGAAAEEWKRGIQMSGLGFASFAALFPGDIHQKLSIFQKVHLIAVTVTTVALIIFYYRKRAIYPLHQYLLFSLKIYLSVFYLFIQLPYQYLMIVPAVIDAALLCHISKKKKPITNA